MFVCSHFKFDLKREHIQKDKMPWHTIYEDNRRDRDKESERKRGETILRVYLYHEWDICWIAKSKEPRAKRPSHPAH